MRVLTIRMPSACVTFWSNRVHLERWQNVLSAVLNCIIGIVGLLLNTAVILSLFKTKQLESSLKVLILCLCLSDLCFLGTTGILDTIVFLKPDADCILEITAEFFKALFGHSSASLTIAIGIHRFAYTQGSYIIGHNIDKIKLCIYCLVSTLFALSTAAFYMIASIYEFYHLAHVVVLSIDLVLLILILVSYMCLYRNVVRHVKNSDNLRRADGIDQQGPGQRGRAVSSDAVSMTRIINRIIIVAHSCYTPYVIIGLVQSLRPNISSQIHSSMTISFLVITFSLVLVNSIMNAVIFLMGNRKSRQFILEMFLTKCDRILVF